MRDLFLSTLLERAIIDRSIVLITADLGFKVLDEFSTRLPDQFLNIGIAEQNMIGVATGLALSGRKVFVYSIANFSSLRCLEQIRNDAAYHNANVKIVSIGSGFSYGQLGFSHHATEDISIMRSLPDVMVCSPSDDVEVIGCTHQIIDTPGTAYLRLDREGFGGEGSRGVAFSPLRARRLETGSRVAIFVSGGILRVALEVSAGLKSVGISPTLVSLHTLAPLDSVEVAGIAASHTHLFTIEEHSVSGGLGGAVAEIASELPSTRPQLFRFGLRGAYSSVVGDQNYLRLTYGLDAATILKKILSVIGFDQRNGD